MARPRIPLWGRALATVLLALASVPFLEGRMRRGLDAAKSGRKG